MHSEMRSVAIEDHSISRNNPVFKLPFSKSRAGAFGMERKPNRITRIVRMNLRHGGFLATEIVADRITINCRTRNIFQADTRLQDLLVVKALVADISLDLALRIFKSSIPSN